jgi:hypothetical protein
MHSAKNRVDVLSLTTDPLALNYVFSRWDGSQRPVHARDVRFRSWKCSKDDRLAFLLKSRSTESSELSRASSCPMSRGGRSKFPAAFCLTAGEFATVDQTNSNSPRQLSRVKDCTIKHERMFQRKRLHPSLSEKTLEGSKS